MLAKTVAASSLTANDLRVTLLDETGNASGTQPLTLFDVAVTDGQFAVDVDFSTDRASAPTIRLKTEVQQRGVGFVALGAPSLFDAKAALDSVCWDTQGNALTHPATNFLGTNDAQPLVRAIHSRSALLGDLVDALARHQPAA